MIPAISRLRQESSYVLQQTTTINAINPYVSTVDTFILSLLSYDMAQVHY